MENYNVTIDSPYNTCHSTDNIYIPIISHVAQDMICTPSGYSHRTVRQEKSMPQENVTSPIAHDNKKPGIGS